MGRQTSDLQNEQRRDERLKHDGRYERVSKCIRRLLGRDEVLILLGL